jgi:hypothetical protein
MAIAVGICFSALSAKTINLDCVIGRRSNTVRLLPSSLSKLFILTPVPRNN